MAMMMMMMMKKMMKIMIFISAKGAQRRGREISLKR